MKVRIVSKGWENFTGSLGFQAVFVDGVSVEDLNPRQIARIGSSIMIVDIETGEQVGPSVVAQAIQSRSAPVVAPATTLDQVEKIEADERDELARQAKAQKAADNIAFKAAQEKAEQAAEEIVIYTRVELEAMAANDGIAKLREIAGPLGVKGRGINEMIKAILEAQGKRALA